MCNVEGPPLKKKRMGLMTDGEPLPIYLDHNATTPICDEGWAAMLDCRSLGWGNPSSTHPYGLHAKHVIETARSTVARSIGVVGPAAAAAGPCIVFTSGGTEANNLALMGGFAAAVERDPSRTLIVATTMEHPAIEEVLTQHFEKAALLQPGGGARVLRIAPDPVTGVVTPEIFDRALASYGDATCRRVALVTVMHANNETGAIQPIPALVAVARSRCGPSVVFHTDAAQTIGKIPVDVEAMGVDMLSICAHKFYGPKGVGALYCRPGGLRPRWVTYGAGHEAGTRPGTENIVLINAMAAAIAVATAKLAENSAHMRTCRDLLAECLADALRPGRCKFVVNGSLAHCLPNTLNIAISNSNNAYISAQRLMSDVGLQVAMSAGSACHSTNGGEAVVVSSSLKSVGVGEERAVGTLRLTTGRLCSVDDMRRAAKIIGRKCVEQLQDL